MGSTIIRSTGATFNFYAFGIKHTKDGIDWANLPKGSYVDKKGVAHKGKERRTPKIHVEQYSLTS